MAFGTITLVQQLRPCLVSLDGEPPKTKALFHKWVPSNDNYPVDKALVEFQDGTLRVIGYRHFRFVDHPHAEYFYPIREEEEK